MAGSVTASTTTTPSLRTLHRQNSFDESGEQTPLLFDHHQDQFCGIRAEPTRDIPGTAYLLTRSDNAISSTGATKELRLNPMGYDRDDPNDAVKKYEQAHPKSKVSSKPRIDRQKLLEIVRKSVDQFPELKVQMKKEEWERLSPTDREAWKNNLFVVRQAQQDYIVNELAKVYPGHVDQNAPTFLYTGGRASGCLKVIHCSFSEYVALYWSDWGLFSTDSGQYKAHVHDYITEGINENWNAEQGLGTDKKDYEATKPGEYTFLGKGNRKIWSYDGPCGMVDHATGTIPSMFGSALVENFTSTLNTGAAWKLVKYQVKLIAHEYGTRIKEFFSKKRPLVKDVLHYKEEDLQKARDYFHPILARAEEPLRGSMFFPDVAEHHVQ